MVDLIVDKIREDLIAGKYSIVSIDIFDTLLLRKSISARWQWWDLSVHFFIRRFFSEFLARFLGRLKGHFEVTSDEIYRFMGPKFSYEQEFEHESSNIFINPEIASLLSLLNDLNIVYIFVSDTHFKSKDLVNLLHSLGVLNPVVFTSSEFKAPKFRGLFYRVNSVLNQQPSRWLHIGDNLKSDVCAASKFGASSIHYVPLRDDVIEFGLVSKAGFRSLCRKSQVGREVLCHLQLALAKFRSLGFSDDEFVQLIGFAIAGPIGLFMANSVHEYSKLLRADSVWFISRDGWIPFNFYRTLFPDENVLYFKVSRKMLNERNFNLYLESLSPERGAIVVFDIGWRGTIFKTLEREKPSLTWFGIYFVLLRKKNRNEAILNKSNLFGIITFWRSRDFLELIFSEPSSSYTELNESLIPCTNPLAQNNSTEFFRKDIWSGVQSSLQISLPTLSERHVDLLLRSLLRYPSYRLRVEASGLVHDTNGDLNHHLIISSWSQLFTSRVLWPQASRLSANHNYLNRMLFKFPLIVKELCQRLFALFRVRF